MLPVSRDVKLVSLPGDGVGPEVVGATLGLLDAVGELWDVSFNVEQVEAGGARFKRTGTVYTEADFEICRAADAILLGALGLPDAVLPDGTEAGPDMQFRLRFDLDLYAGVRPIRRLPGIPGPLRADHPFSFTVIRENTEGLYASRGGGSVVADRVATDTSVLTAVGVDRVCRFAFEYALAHPRLGGGRPLVTSVDKANVLRSYAFWRRHFDLVSNEYAPRVDAGRMYVDAFCAHLVLAPQAVHVAVAENMFGDIVSDLAGALAGSLGLAPSADIGDAHAVFQSAHGSAPDIAGKGVANPVATILSAVMMLEWLGLDEVAADLRQATETSLADNNSRTADVGGSAGTQAAAQAVIAALRGPS